MKSEWRRAAVDGDVDLIERRLDEGQAVDALDSYGQTALMLAATYGRKPVVDLLLAHDADPDLTAKYGLSALMLAIVNRHTDVAAALVAAGADTTLRGTGAPGFAGKMAGDLARDAGFTDLGRAIALARIEGAFADRAPPSTMTDSKQLSDVEHDEVMSFESLRWQDVTFAQVETNSDAVFWFSPEAFCYYLPGLLSAGLRENRWDANAYDSIIGMLDRSAEPGYWDDFFLPRWPLLSAAEIGAVAEWVRCFETAEPDAFHDNTYERAQATLALLIERCEGGT